MHRFYLPAEDWVDGLPSSLAGDEAHHCRRVARVKEGDEVEVIDGMGRSVRVRVAAFRGELVELDPLAEPEFVARPSPLVHLAFAIPKGRNVELVIRKAAELGADRITPVVTARTIARPEPGGGSPGRPAKWGRMVLEVAKQCGRRWVPEVAAPVGWDAFLASVDGSPGFLCSLVPESRPLRDHLDSLGEEAVSRSEQVVLAVGPEGDFTPAEYEAARIAGLRDIDLGKHVLRAETASIAGLAILAYELRMLCPTRG